MLQIVMPLAVPARQPQAEGSELPPFAAVEVEAQGRHKRVHIRLEGVIGGEHADTFLEFLKAVSHFAGSRWTLQMKDLKVLSLQGMRHLVHFAESLRASGHQLEVHGVHRNVYATLQDLNLVRAFAWAD